jgi:hypothetical protein
MMSTNNPVDMLGVVAKVLEKLPQQVVFTGGATIPLYLDAYSAAEMRPTDDVDCVVETVSQADYYRLAKKLRELGLSEDFEDIITVLNGCPDLQTKIQNAEIPVKKFVVEWVRLERKNLDNLAPAFLSGEESLSGRGAMLLEVIDRLAGLELGA